MTGSLDPEDVSGPLEPGDEEPEEAAAALEPREDADREEAGESKGVFEKGKQYGAEALSYITGLESKRSLLGSFHTEGGGNWGGQLVVDNDPNRGGDKSLVAYNKDEQHEGQTGTGITRRGILQLVGGAAAGSSFLNNNGGRESKPGAATGTTTPTSTPTEQPTTTDQPTTDEHTETPTGPKVVSGSKGFLYQTADGKVYLHDSQGDIELPLDAGKIDADEMEFGVQDDGSLIAWNMENKAITRWTPDYVDDMLDPDRVFERMYDDVLSGRSTSELPDGAAEQIKMPEESLEEAATYTPVDYSEITGYMSENDYLPHLADYVFDTPVSQIENKPILEKEWSRISEE